MLCPRCFGTRSREVGQDELECASPVVAALGRTTAGVPDGTAVCGYRFTADESTRAEHAMLGARTSPATLVETRPSRPPGEPRATVDDLGRAMLQEVADPIERLLLTVAAFVDVEERLVSHPGGTVRRRQVAASSDVVTADRVMPGAFGGAVPDVVLRDPRDDERVARWFARWAGRAGVAPQTIAWPTPRKGWLGGSSVVAREFVDERPGPAAPGWRFDDGSTLRPFGSGAGMALVAATGALHLGPLRLVRPASGVGLTSRREGRLTIVALRDMAALLGLEAPALDRRRLARAQGRLRAREARR